MTTLSSSGQLDELQSLIKTYWLLPEIFRSPHISGSFMERALAHARGGEALATYDFIDVLCDDKTIGFQVKATKDTTVVTWMRAKIPNKQSLVTASQVSDSQLRADSLQKLGDTIIDFVNKKIEKSFRKYKKVHSIHYARVRHISTGRVEYVEAPLCNRSSMILFDKDDFSWEWRKNKDLEAKIAKANSIDPLIKNDIEAPNPSEASQEVISSLQGIYNPTGEVWWAWHGKSDNQLHFPGEAEWLSLHFAAIGLDMKSHSFSLDLPIESIGPDEMIGLLKNFKF